MRALLQLLRRLHAGIGSRTRNVWLRSLGVQIDGYVWLRKVDIRRGHSRIHLCTGVALDTQVSIICSDGDSTDALAVRIGERTYINRQTILDASQSIRIGKDCMIGPFCYLTDHDHRIDGNTAPSQLGLTEASTNIGNRVWLGSHVSVLKGVNIGDNTVVGAGSVVTKDLPAGVLAVGSPAKVIKQLDSRSPLTTKVALEA